MNSLRNIWLSAGGNFSSARMREPGQVGVGPPMSQYLDRRQAIRRGDAVQIRRPAVDVGLQPLPRLLATAGPLRLAQRCPILAASVARQDGRDGGVVAEGCLHVICQSWSSGEGIGEESRGGGKPSLDATEVGELEAFGGVNGPVLALEDGRESAFQGQQALAAPQLLGQVGVMVITLGKQFEAAASGGLSFAQPPPR